MSWKCQLYIRQLSPRYQLEAFVDKITGKEPVHWIEPGDIINQMRTMDAIYDKSGAECRVCKEGLTGGPDLDAGPSIAILEDTRGIMESGIAVVQSVNGGLWKQF